MKKPEQGATEANYGASLDAYTRLHLEDLINYTTKRIEDKLGIRVG